MDVLKVGVVGAGHMGKIHGKLLHSLPMFDFQGFYDPAAQASDTPFPYFDSLQSLLDACQCLSICSSTVAHAELAEAALRQGKHVFIEKPITQTAAEAQHLLHFCGPGKPVVAVGQVERFNPAFTAARPLISNPRRIEAVRYATQGSRGLDVSVVLDMMIHDIDLILALIQAPIASIQASGHRSFTQSCDTAQVSLEFENGSQALMLASRAHVRRYRSLTVYEDHQTLDLDLLNHSLAVQPWKGQNPSTLYPEIIPNNAILDELEDWGQAIFTGKSPRVDALAGLKNVDLAEKIIQSMRYADSNFS